MAQSTLHDLMRTEGQAELIGGTIVRYPPDGWFPARIRGEILVSLDEHCDLVGRGKALSGTLVYAVPELPSGRESFSPDVSYYDGPLPSNRMSFIVGPPTFAVEVRNESDYVPSAELAITAKRADYFAAGTLVVWDVDPLAETIDCYRASTPDAPVRFQRGQTADAEPAVPGWRIGVDDVFDSV